jgi:sec-independent protein translocase protein TatA
MQVGPGEIIMLVIILVIVFSASQMGALGNTLGRFVYSFRKASQGEGFVDVKATSRLGTEQPAQKSERGSEDAQLIDGAPKH